MEKTRGHPTDSQDATCKHQREACSLTGMLRQQHGPRIRTAEKHTHIGEAAPRFGKANSDKKHAEEKKKARQKHAITTGKPDKGWCRRTHKRTSHRRQMGGNGCGRSRVVLCEQNGGRVYKQESEE
ncbi:hypothetical protein, conserved in T. vivax, partial [Trypanosoma vivax Y486]